MRKDLHNNERYLKELSDKHKPIPPPMVWDDIEQELDKNKGKRRLFPFIWIFGALLMGTVIFINKKGRNNTASLVEQETIINDNQKLRDPNTMDPNTKNIRTANSETTNETANESVNGSVNGSINEVNQARIKSGQSSNFSETIPTVIDNQDEYEVDSERLNPFTTPQQKKQLNNLNSSDAERSINPNRNTINSNATAINTEDDILSPSVSTPSILEDKNIVHLTSLQRLKWISRPLQTVKPFADPSENMTTSPTSKTKGDTSLSSPWFVEFGVGIGRNLSKPILIDTLQGAFRLNTESKWYSWSTSLQLGYQFENLWYTSIGLDLNQTKNRFDILRRDVSSLSVGADQNFQITTVDFFNTGETRYTYADIRISIGKRININNWQFSFEGGPIFNAHFYANGKVQVGSLEFSRLEDQEEYFNAQLGIGARLSAMIDYPISDQLWISVGPSYHQYFNTVSSVENPLEERSAILQLKAKIRHHF